MTTAERPPASLLVAAVLVLVEGVVLLVYGLAQLSALGDGRPTLVLTSTLFFVVYGGALVVFGRLLTQLRSWARAPVVLAQLIQLGVAYSFRGGDTTAVAVLLAVVAAVVLVGLLHPASTRAIDRAERAGEG